MVPGVGSDEALTSNGNGTASEAGYTTGRVDLVFHDDEGIVVVDYKTDALGAAAMEGHAGQAETYGRGVGAATGLEVKDVVLVFARTGAEARLER